MELKDNILWLRSHDEFGESVLCVICGVRRSLTGRLGIIVHVLADHRNTPLARVIERELGQSGE